MATPLRDDKSGVLTSERTREVPETTLLGRIVGQLAHGLSASGFRLFRPFAPQVLPLAAFVFTIPVLVFFSISAGWLVWRSIAIGWETSLYLQYGDGTPPNALVSLPTLASQQPYDISLHLVVPSSQANIELGNFMTTLTLSTTSNRTIASVRRPALVLPPSSSAVSLAMGQRGTVHLKIPLVTGMEMGVSNVVAQVEIGRRDDWRAIGSGVGRELSVSSAVLRGVVVHQGLRGLLTRFPLLTAISAAGTFFFISFIILATCLLPVLEWPTQAQLEVAKAEPDVEKPPRRRRDDSSGSRRGRKNRSGTIPRRSRSATEHELKREPAAEVKIEETSTTVPPAESSSTPLRRRRSRLSQGSDPDS